MKDLGWGFPRRALVQEGTGATRMTWTLAEIGLGQEDPVITNLLAHSVHAHSTLELILGWEMRLVMMEGQEAHSMMAMNIQAGTAGTR